MFFFHRLAKVRQSSKQMFMLRNWDCILDTTDAIENHVLQYFTSLYPSENCFLENDLVDRVVPSLVSNEDNVFLTNFSSMEEVKSTVFDMNGVGAPGPDVYGGCFFQKLWHVGSNVHSSVLKFFK